MWSLMKYLGERESLPELKRYTQNACLCQAFSNARIYFITGKQQQDPQGLDHLEILCWKGHLNNIVKLEGEKGYEERRHFLISKKIHLELDLFLYWLFLFPPSSLSYNKMASEILTHK